MDKLIINSLTIGKVHGLEDIFKYFDWIINEL